MKLVIAEKPSVAMSRAAVLGANEKKDGYREGGDYLVSWCVGHLLEQKRKAYSAYKQARADMKELYNVRANVEHLLDIPTGREPQKESQKSRQ